MAVLSRLRINSAISTAHLVTKRSSCSVAHICLSLNSQGKMSSMNFAIQLCNMIVGCVTLVFGYFSMFFTRDLFYSTLKLNKNLWNNFILRE